MGQFNFGFWIDDSGGKALGIASLRASPRTPAQKQATPWSGRERLLD
ncbi:MAG: hypothetical protein V7L14_15290 [Nostoc sp.]